MSNAKFKQLIELLKLRTQSASNLNSSTKAAFDASAIFNKGDSSPIGERTVVELADANLEEQLTNLRELDRAIAEVFPAPEDSFLKRHFEIEITPEDKANAAKTFQKSLKQVNAAVDKAVETGEDVDYEVAKASLASSMVFVDALIAVEEVSQELSNEH